MPAGPTYELIASTTLASPALTITFNSIPQTYTDLVSITYISSANSGNDTFVQVNGTSSAGLYGYQSFDGQSTVSAAASRNASSGALIAFQYGYVDSSKPLFITSHFSDYTNNTNYKSINSIVAASYSTILPATINTCVYRSSSPITSLTFNIGASTINMGTGTVISLYGIKAA